MCGPVGSRDADPLPNVWVGTSIESWRFNWRADRLREVPAAVRFISAEPLLDTLYGKRGLDLTDIDWLIAGGESGPKHRPMERWWVEELRDACLVQGTAFFFKQWGGRTAKAGGRELNGQTYSEMPTSRASREASAPTPLLVPRNTPGARCAPFGMRADRNVSERKES